MKVSISDLKAHVEAWVVRTGNALEGDVHQRMKQFAEFVEGKQAEADATSYLEAKGYTVTPPAQANT